MLSKLSHVLDIKTLRSVYYSIFESHLCYASLVWAQNTYSVKRFPLLQKKFLRIMFFQNRNSHTDPSFKVSKILMFFDKIIPENWIFWICLLPSIFSNWFKFSFESQSHSHDTRESNLVILQYPLTVLKPVVDIKCLWIQHVWNHLQSCHQNVIFHQLRANKLKQALITFFLNRNN